MRLVQRSLDTLKRFAFKSGDYKMPHHPTSLVSYQGEFYIAENGLRYNVTHYPLQVDNLGVI